MKNALRNELLALLLCCLGSGCSADDATRVAAPVHPRAAWVLEGGAPRIGEVAQLDAVVTTPPGDLPAAFDAPRDVPGFELQGSESWTTLKRPGRWIHRASLRIRAREVGRLEWPAAQIEIESIRGERTRLTLEPLTIEIRSVMAEHPDRDTPYGVIEVPGALSGWDFARGVAVGGLSTLALVGLVAILRRRRTAATSRDFAKVSTLPVTPWVEACAALARAREEADPIRSAHIAAEALALYTAQRFGADTHARTTEELAAAMPPLRATSRWPVFVSILRELDALRFRPALERSQGAIAALLVRAEAFIDDTTPKDGGSP